MSPGLGLTFPGQRTASRGPRVSIFERCGHRGPNNTRGQNNTRFQRPVEKAFSCSAPKMPRSGRSGQLRVTYQQRESVLFIGTQFSILYTFIRDSSIHGPCVPFSSPSFPRELNDQSLGTVMRVRISGSPWCIHRTEHLNGR